MNCREPFGYLQLDTVSIAGARSQKELAERLGLKEHQIQLYEATDYGSASLTRLKEIAKALCVNIAGEMTYLG